MLTWSGDSEISPGLVENQDAIDACPCIVGMLADPKEVMLQLRYVNTSSFPSFSQAFSFIKVQHSLATLKKIISLNREKWMR